MKAGPNFVCLSVITPSDKSSELKTVRLNTMLEDPLVFHIIELASSAAATNVKCTLCTTVVKIISLKFKMAAHAR